MKLPAMISVLTGLALTGFAMPSALAQTSDATVAVEGGKILGTASDVAGVTIYKAVPFAAPPVGPNRWRAPQPVVAWSGVRESTRMAEPVLPARQRQSARNLLRHRILLGSVEGSQGQRRLSLPEHLGARETCRRYAAGDGVLSRRRQPPRQQFRGRVQRGETRRQGRHRRHGGLPAQHHGLSRFARHERGRRRKFCGAGRGGSAEMGEEEYRSLRRRFRQGDDCRPVGRIAQCQKRAFDAAFERPVPARDHALQPHHHGAAGQSEFRDARGEDGRGSARVREVLSRQDRGRFEEAPGGRVLQRSGKGRGLVWREQRQLCRHRRQGPDARIRSIC